MNMRECVLRLLQSRSQMQEVQLSLWWQMEFVLSSSSKELTKCCWKEEKQTTTTKRQTNIRGMCIHSIAYTYPSWFPYDNRIYRCCHCDCCCFCSSLEMCNAWYRMKLTAATPDGFYEFTTKSCVFFFVFVWQKK